jgi:anti-sigma factor RsiW
MRCVDLGPLVERFVDGGLDPSVSRSVEAHAAGCPRCAARIQAARVVARALEGAAPARAPAGFLDGVMNAVHRESLAPRPAVPEQRRARGIPVLRMYRRAGLCFMLTAAVLTGSLFIPSAAYQSLVTERGIRAGSDAAVAARGTLDGAGAAVRGLLGSTERGGGSRR